MNTIEGIRDTAVRIQPRSLRSYLRHMQQTVRGMPNTRVEDWAVVTCIRPLLLARPLEPGGRWTTRAIQGRHLMVWSPPAVVWVARRWHGLRQWVRGLRGVRQETQTCR
jgi:hypothetical protein